MKWRKGNRVSGITALTASSSGAAAISSGSTNTKGAFAELISATPHEVPGFYFLFHPNSASARDYLVDIAIGGSGSEVVIVPNIPYSTQNSMCQVAALYIPIGIPEGTRLSFRLQASAASQGLNAQVILPASGPMGGQMCEAFGPATADSGAQSIDPGGTANTLGGYTQLASATSFAYEWLMVTFANQGQVARSQAFWLIDIAVGAAASEVVVVPQLPGHVVINSCFYATFMFPVSIPAGSRIAVRAQCSVNTATVRLIDVAIHGFA